MRIDVRIVGLLLPLVGCGGGGGGTNPVTPVPTTITITSPGSNLDAVGATAQLSAAVGDQRGQAIASPSVSWASLNAAVATVSTSGVVTAISNGTASIKATSDTAHAQVTITVQQVPSALVKVSGNGQTGASSSALAAPLVVQVNDRLGHLIAGVTVAFATATGSVTPIGTLTNTNGQAQTTWTLGPTAGQQSATASVTGIATPATFTATATSGGSASITAITPDTLVEGQSATIAGTGFSSTPASNTVSIGGATATVTAASATSLTVTVPTSNCQPARDAAITVTVASLTSNAVTKRVNPAAFLNLAVGQQAIVANPAQFCLQFRASTTGGDAYLIGVGASAESPSTTVPFNITAVAGAATPAAPFGAVRPLPLPRSVSGTVSPSPAAARAAAQLRADMVLREWERRNLQGASAASGAARVPPSAGDTVLFNVPTDFSNSCNVFATVKTVVRKVGTAGIWVTDVTNPTADSLTSAQISAYSDTFDTKIYAIDTAYFGAPSDLDANQRVFVVLTVQVNKIDIDGNGLGDVAGFVFGGDLFSPASCAGSNQGEIFYGFVPDSLNVAGKGAHAKSIVLAYLPNLIAHEFTHDIQLSRRLVLASGTSLSVWEAEGQAMLAEEVVGHSMLGNSPGNNYGASIAFTPNVGDRWYGFAAGGLFSLLPQYFGWLGGNPPTKATGAPELCTLFGSTSLVTACNSSAFYGASWSFQRYLSDRYGPGYAGGEKQLNRDLIGKNVSLRGVANIQALLPSVNFDTLFDRWAAMLYVDDRVTGLPPELTLASWNLFNIGSAYISDAFRLIPTDRTFAAFTDARSVRGGSTAYTRLSAAGVRPALALRVRSQVDAVLGTGMKPQLWIVRIQ